MAFDEDTLRSFSNISQNIADKVSPVTSSPIGIDVPGLFQYKGIGGFLGIKRHMHEQAANQKVASTLQMSFINKYAQQELARINKRNEFVEDRALDALTNIQKAAQTGGIVNPTDFEVAETFLGEIPQAKELIDIYKRSAQTSPTTGFTYINSEQVQKYREAKEFEAQAKSEIDMQSAETKLARDRMDLQQDAAKAPFEMAEKKRGYSTRDLLRLVGEKKSKNEEELARIQAELKIFKGTPRGDAAEAQLKELGTFDSKEELRGLVAEAESLNEILNTELLDDDTKSGLLNSVDSGDTSSVDEGLSSIPAGDGTLSMKDVLNADEAELDEASRFMNLPENKGKYRQERELISKRLKELRQNFKNKQRKIFGNK